MADVKNIPQVDNIVKLLEAYTVGVRGGVMTPCMEDEASFRLILGLPEMSESVKKDWASSKGVRRPITLQRPADAGGGQSEMPAPQDPTSKEI